MKRNNVRKNVKLSMKMVQPPNDLLPDVSLSDKDMKEERRVTYTSVKKPGGCDARPPPCLSLCALTSCPGVQVSHTKSLQTDALSTRIVPRTVSGLSS